MLLWNVEEKRYASKRRRLEKKTLSYVRSTSCLRDCTQALPSGNLFLPIKPLFAESAVLWSCNPYLSSTLYWSASQTSFISQLLMQSMIACRKFIDKKMHRCFISVYTSFVICHMSYFSVIVQCTVGRKSRITLLFTSGLLKIRIIVYNISYYRDHCCNLLYNLI